MIRCTALLSLAAIAACADVQSNMSDAGTSDAGAPDAGMSDAGTPDAAGANAGIRILANSFASDENGGIDAGTCTVSNSPAAASKSGGMLELDPYLNPNAAYTLELLVENDLPTVGVQDFVVEKATLTYLDIEGNLTGPSQDLALLSGTVRAGGAANATVLPVTGIGADAVSAWAASFANSPNLGTSGGFSEDVVVQITLDGVLASGNQATSAAFNFPVSLCFGCGNLPLGDGGPPVANQAVPYCEHVTTPVAIGHGPCCAPQDFYVACEPCGAPEFACCGGSQDGTCDTGTCTGPAPSGVEVCPRIANETTTTCSST